MKNLWIVQFLGTFLGSSKKPFYKVNRANGWILYRVSVRVEFLGGITKETINIASDYLGGFTFYRQYIDTLLVIGWIQNIDPKFKWISMEEALDK